MRNPRLYPLNQVLTIDGGIHPVLPEHRCRDDGHFLDSSSGCAVAATFGHLPAPNRGWVGAWRHSGFYEARWVKPDVKLPHLRTGRCGNWIGALSVDVPGIVAADDKCLPFALLARRSSEPTRAVFPRPRVQARPTTELLHRGPEVIVNGSSVVSQRLAARPICILGEILAHFAGVTRA